MNNNKDQFKSSISNDDVNYEDDNEIEMLEESLASLEESDSSDDEKDRNETNDEYKVKYDDLYERFLRLAADFDNIKKRNAKEKTEILNYGNEELIKTLLNVIDNLERAIEHSGNDLDDNTDAIVKGVKLVHEQFISCLEKFDVTIIKADKGVKFNPIFHQAIEKVNSDEFESGIIISETLKGYMLKDRLLRPSMVIVSEREEQSKSIKSENEDEEDLNIPNESNLPKSENSDGMIDITNK